MSTKSVKARCVAADRASWLTVGETYDCTEVKGVMLIRIRNRPVMAMEKEEFSRCFEVGATAQPSPTEKDWRGWE